MATRILHILLAVLVFFSSTGLILVHHYCNKELKNIAVFVDFESCGDTWDSENCCQKNTLKNCCQLPKNTDNPDCCDTKIVYLKSDFVSVALLEEKVDFENFDFLKTVPKSTTLNPFKNSKNNFPFQHYLPPDLVGDFPVLFQSFLC